jgi:hypothetical protein
MEYHVYDPLLKDYISNGHPSREDALDFIRKHYESHPEYQGFLSVVPSPEALRQIKILRGFMFLSLMLAFCYAIDVVVSIHKNINPEWHHYFFAFGSLASWAIGLLFIPFKKK